MSYKFFSKRMISIGKNLIFMLIFFFVCHSTAFSNDVYEEGSGVGIFILLLFYSIPAIVYYFLAKKYNRNKFLWAILGFFFSLFAILILYLLFKPVGAGLTPAQEPASAKKIKQKVDLRDAEERIKNERLEKERKENERLEAERKKSSAQTGRSSTTAQSSTTNRYLMSIVGKWKLGDGDSGIYLEFKENGTFSFYNNDYSVKFNGQYGLKGDQLSITIPGMGSDTVKISEGMGFLHFSGELFKRV